MKEMTLETASFNVINSLVRTRECGDQTTILKGLLGLFYLAQKNGDDFWNKVHCQDVEGIIRMSLEDGYLNKIGRTIPTDGIILNWYLEAIRGLHAIDYSIFTNLLINQIAGINGKRTDFIYDNYSLSNLIALVAKKMGMEHVLAPFAGIASYACSSEFDGIKFTGYEQIVDLAIIANLRLAIAGKESEVEIMNFLRDPENISLSEDVIATPPFNMPFDKERLHHHYASRYVHEFIIEKFLDDRDARKGIFLVPLNFAYSDSTEWLRKELLAWSVIDMVISIPSGILMGTNVPCLLLTLDKDKWDKRQDENISFISLNDSVYTEGKMRKMIDIDKAKSLLSGHSNGLIEVVKMSDVDSSYRLDLNPGAYLLHKVMPKGSSDSHNANLFALTQKINCATKAVNLGTSKSVIGVKDLSPNYTFTVIEEPSSITTSRYSEISEDAALINFTSNGVEVGRVKYSGKPIALSTGIFACKQDGIVDDDYLLLELTKPYVADQIRLLGLTSYSSPNIGDYIFHYLKLVVEPYEERMRIVREAQEKVVSKLQIGLETAQSDFRKDVHMKRHAMGQTIGTLNNWWSLLEELKSSQTGAFDLQCKVPGLSTTLDDILKNVKSNIKRLSTQIDKLDRGFKYSATDFDLWEAIQEYVETHKTPVFNYTLDFPKEWHSDEDGKFYFVFPDESGLIKTRVHFPKEVLTMILNNILSNASTHGFKNKPSDDNIVRITLLAKDSSYIVSISNNGVPCNPDMTAEKVVMYGKSSDENNHCGIGGYEAKFLMNDFGQKLEVHLDSSSEYPVEYKLIFNALRDE